MPVSAGLEAFILAGWADAAPEDPVRALAPAERCAARRRALADLVGSDRLVVPAGRPARRGNGVDLRFRAESDYVYLTGDATAGGVLVIDPDGGATLFLDPPLGRGDLRFYNDNEQGDFWVGARPSLADVEAALGIRCRPANTLQDHVGTAAPRTRVLRSVDPAVDALVKAGDPFPDRELRALISELRLVKDEWEIEQVEAAIATTIQGFEDVARGLSSFATEREVETAFLTRARNDGNDAAFNTIAAAGHHAATLHWVRNDGRLSSGELILVDAGAESRTLYAADLTRTYPVSGAYSKPQRRMIELVNDAIDVALEAIAPGRPFRDFHRAVAATMAAGLADWGLVPADAAEDDLHRRYTICAPGHMLGLDVHDCPHARAGTYLDGVLEPGHVLTVEPGLYFQPDDLTLPEELRGVGVRVEEDVVVTETGWRNLSAALPRRADDVEDWIARLE